MGRLCRLAARLWGDEHGQDLVEYGMLMALIVVAAIGALQGLGGTLHSELADLSAELGRWLGEG